MTFLKSVNVEFPFAIVLQWHIEISALASHEIQQLAECDVFFEHCGIAYEHKPQARTSHRHVQLAVNQLSVLLKHVVCEEIKLVGLLDRKAVDDIVALAALIAFDSVYRDVVKTRYAILVYLVADG